MDDRSFYVSFGFLNESFTLNEIGELEKTSLPTAAVKEETTIFSSALNKGFGLWSLTMANNKALIDQLVLSIRGII